MSDDLSQEDVVSITTALKNMKDDYSDNFDDFFEMIKDIKNHVKQNGPHIVQEDRPTQLRIGFRCSKTNKTWSIKIIKIKNLMNQNDESSKVILDCLKTQAGKDKLIEMLNK